MSLELSEQSTKSDDQKAAECIEAFKPLADAAALSCPKCNKTPDVFTVGISSRCRVQCFSCNLAVSEDSDRATVIKHWNFLVRAIEARSVFIEACRTAHSAMLLAPHHPTLSESLRHDIEKILEAEDQQ